MTWLGAAGFFFFVVVACDADAELGKMSTSARKARSECTRGEKSRLGLSVASELLFVRDSACRVLEVRHIFGRLPFFFCSEVCCSSTCLLSYKFNCYCCC